MTTSSFISSTELSWNTTREYFLQAHIGTFIVGYDFKHKGYSVRLVHASPNGKFSTPSGRIDFASGNLQYHCTQHTWRFAQHQYIFIGAANANISQCEYDGRKLMFGVEGFDKNKHLVQDAFTSVDGSNINSQFFKQDWKIWKDSQWYFARGIIHAYGSKNVFGTHTNLGIGTDLVFNGSRVKYILPKIQVVESQNKCLSISFWDYTIRPLVRGNNIIPLKTARTYNAKSFGFIQANNFTFTYARNNNNALSDDELAVIIERYLYPMDTTNMIHIYNR
jgi:hypothetical protein